MISVRMIPQGWIQDTSSIGHWHTKVKNKDQQIIDCPFSPTLPKSVHDPKNNFRFGRAHHVGPPSARHQKAMISSWPQTHPVGFTCASIAAQVAVPVGLGSRLVSCHAVTCRSAANVVCQTPTCESRLSPRVLRPEKCLHPVVSSEHNSDKTARVPRRSFKSRWAAGKPHAPHSTPSPIAETKYPRLHTACHRERFDEMWL